MPQHVRFRPEQYKLIAAAAQRMGAVLGYSGFRRQLADAVRPASPELADAIESLGDAQTRALRDGLHQTRPAESASRLTFDEWRVLGRAAELIRLRGQGLTPSSLVAHTAEESPALAEKITTLSVGNLARLFHALNSGRRCCLS